MTTRATVSWINGSSVWAKLNLQVWAAISFTLLYYRGRDFRTLFCQKWRRPRETLCRQVCPGLLGTSEPTQMPQLLPKKTAINRILQVNITRFKDFSSVGNSLELIANCLRLYTPSYTMPLLFRVSRVQGKSCGSTINSTILRIAGNEAVGVVWWGGHDLHCFRTGTDSPVGRQR